MSYEPRHKTVDTTIAESAAITAEIDLEDYRFMAIHMPAAWTAADIAFQAASASGGTFQDVYNDVGTLVQVDAAASRVIVIDTHALSIAAMRFIKIQSHNGSAQVNQAAERDLTVELSNG